MDRESRGARVLRFAVVFVVFAMMLTTTRPRVAFHTDTRPLVATFTVFDRMQKTASSAATFGAFSFSFSILSSEFKHKSEKTQIKLAPGVSFHFVTS